MIGKIALALVVGIGFSLAGSVTGSDTATAATKKERLVYDFATSKWVKPRRHVRRKAPSAKYRRRSVSIQTNEKPGTIIVDTSTRYLYLVTSKNRAVRYGIGVGREGFEWQGVVKLARKAKWPSWTPPKEMIEREWRQNKRRVGFMKGGPKNPLGARALYLHNRGGDTGYRIHGTNEPWSIGLSMSSGCIRLLNKDVEHLYERADKGAKVIVIGPNGKDRGKYYKAYSNPIAALFSQ